MSIHRMYWCECDKCGRHGPDRPGELAAMVGAERQGWRVFGEAAMCKDCLENAREIKANLRQRRT